MYDVISTKASETFKNVFKVEFFKNKVLFRLRSFRSSFTIRLRLTGCINVGIRTVLYRYL
jgi:hypothetical protein